MSTAAVRDNWLGRVIDGKFALTQWLGSTGQCDVFLTELQGPGTQKVAIKLVPASAKGAQDCLSRWKAAMNLSHPHLIRIFQTGSCQFNGVETLYAVMEYAEEDLSQILPQRALSPVEVGEMLRPLINVLSYLHGKGFVHGHLKPSNIMAVEDRLTLSCDSIQTIGNSGRLRSDPVYAAPEAAGMGIYPPADVWSLGITLVEVLTQQPPEVKQGAELVLSESIPQPYRDIARDCLRVKPGSRCTLADVKSRVEDQRSQSHAIEDRSEVGRAARSRLGPATIAIGIVVVLVAVIAALKMGSHQATPAPAESQQSTVAPASQSTPAAAQANAKGEVVERVVPDVPRSASRTITGKIKVKIHLNVGANGEVSNAKFESAGSSKYFANLAMQAARRWKFKAPQVGGQAVASLWSLRFQFSRSSTDATAVQTSP